MITDCISRSDIGLLVVHVANTQLTVEVSEEELVFTGFDLVASVGGYLGLYLGASIISLYEMGFDAFNKFLGRKYGV